MARLIVGAVVLIATAGLYLWPLSDPGLWIAGDNPFYLAVAYAVAENLSSSQGLLGWSIHDLGGFPLFSLFVPSALGTLGVVVAHHTGLVPLPWAYKAMVSLAVLLPPLSLWFILARRAGAAVAFLVANLGLLLTYHLVQPLNGGWGAYLSAGLLVLCLSVGEAWFTGGATWRRALAIVSLASGVTLSDASGWIALPCAVGALAVTYGARSGNASRVVGWAALTLCPLATWIALLTLGGGGTWGSGSTVSASPWEILLRLPAWFLFPSARVPIVEDLLPALRATEWVAAALLAGRLLLEHLPELVVVSLAVVGASKIVRLRSGAAEPLQRWGMANLVLVGLLLVAILTPRHASGGWSTASAWLGSPHRLVPYVNVALLSLGATVLAGLPSGLRAISSWRSAVVVLLALSLTHGVRYMTYGEYVLLKTAGQSVVREELADVWSYLRVHASPTRTRVLYETLEGVGFLDGGTSKLAALSAHETGLSSLASWDLPTLSWVRRPPLLSGEYPLRSLSRLQEIMHRWNCSYVVIWWPGTREKLQASGAFEIVHESPDRLFAVLRARDYEPSWLAFDRPVPRREKVEEVRNGKLRFSVENPWAGNRAVLKMTYHPGWHLSVNGNRVSLAAEGQQIRTGPLPDGSLDLTFIFLGPWESQT